MQTLGTEWGRDCIYPGIWTDLWVRGLVEFPAIVCDDVRFPNEVEMIRKIGGVIVKIERPGAGTNINVGHPSEALHLIQPDACVSNDGTQEELFRNVDFVLDGLFQKEKI